MPNIIPIFEDYDEELAPELSVVVGYITASAVPLIATPPILSPELIASVNPLATDVTPEEPEDWLIDKTVSTFIEPYVTFLNITFFFKNRGAPTVLCLFTWSANHCWRSSNISKNYAAEIPKVVITLTLFKDMQFKPSS